MSYCRWSDDSDIYLYRCSERSFSLHINDNILSKHPSLNEIDQHSFTSQAELLAAIEKIRTVAPETMIPDDVVARLKFEYNHGLDGSVSDIAAKTYEIMNRNWTERN